MRKGRIYEYNKIEKKLRNSTVDESVLVSSKLQNITVIDKYNSVI